jgi:hypothetical protein
MLDLIAITDARGCVYAGAAQMTNITTSGRAFSRESYFTDEALAPRLLEHPQEHPQVLVARNPEFKTTGLVE